MSFKDEYNELQRQIAPDEEFIERLAEKMRNEKTKKKKNKSRFRAVILSSVAGCAAAAAALVIIANRPQPQARPAPFPDILGVGADKIDRQDGLFISSGIEAAAVSPEDLTEILVSENSTVYRSNERTFDFDDKLGREQRLELAKRFENAAETSSELSEVVEYYMAVSESGNVVKFSVSGNVLIIGDKRYTLY